MVKPHRVEYIRNIVTGLYYNEEVENKQKMTEEELKKILKQFDKEEQDFSVKNIIGEQE